MDQVEQLSEGALPAAAESRSAVLISPAARHVATTTTSLHAVGVMPATTATPANLPVATTPHRQSLARRFMENSMMQEAPEAAQAVAHEESALAHVQPASAAPKEPFFCAHCIKSCCPDYQRYLASRASSSSSFLPPAPPPQQTPQRQRHVAPNPSTPPPHLSFGGATAAAFSHFLSSPQRAGVVFSLLGSPGMGLMPQSVPPSYPQL